MAQKLRPLRVRVKEKGGKITTAGRRALSSRQFALPDGNRPGVAGRYPMDTIARARNALARVSAHGTPAEQRAVRRAVYAKFPELKARAKARGK